MCETARSGVMKMDDWRVTMRNNLHLSPPTICLAFLLLIPPAFADATSDQRTLQGFSGVNALYGSDDGWANAGGFDLHSYSQDATQRLVRVSDRQLSDRPADNVDAYV